MISLKTDAKITIVMPHQNKALAMAMALATPVQLEQLKEGKDLKSIVNFLLQSKTNTTKSDHVLLDILKNNTVFKQFGNLPNELKNVITILKNIPDMTPKLAKLEASLKSIEELSPTALKKQINNSGIFMESKIASVSTPLQIVRETLQTIQKALAQTNHNEAKDLATNLTELLEHPVFEKANSDPACARVLIKTIQTLTTALERILPRIDPITPHEIKNTDTIHAELKKLTPFTKPEHLLIPNLLEEHLNHDVKSQLMQLDHELKTLPSTVSKEITDKIDQLITAIDYHQLLSHLDGSNTLYFPFAWEQLEEGSLSFKKRESKKFYCEINLQLKEYGKIDLMMALYEGNQLEIQAHTEKTELKHLIQEHLGTLRTLLTQAGVTPRSIRIYDAKESSTPSKTAYSNDDSDFQSGFEVKV
jgi:flagellar hook-length control protein FliK